MEIAVLIEPLKDGGFRARTAEPFDLVAEGRTIAEATRELGARFDELLAQGKQVGALTVANGKAKVTAVSPLPADNAYQTDWVFREIQNEITENRRQEDAANP